MSYTLQNPLAYFPLPTKSSAAGLCKLYAGLIDTDPLTPANQVQVYAVQPDGSELAIPQPIQLSAGGVPQYNGSPVQLKINADVVSVKVTTSIGALVSYTPRWSADVNTAALGAENSEVLIGGVKASALGDGATATLRSLGWSFGQDIAPFLQAAASQGVKTVLLGKGAYKCSRLALTSAFQGVKIKGVGSGFAYTPQTTIEPISSGQTEIFISEAGTSGVDNVKFEGFRLNGLDQCGYGIRQLSGAGWEYTGLSANNFNEWALWAQQGLNYYERLFITGSSNGNGIALFSDFFADNLEVTGGKVGLRVLAGGGRLSNILINSQSECCLELAPLDNNTNHINTAISNLYIGEVFNPLERPIIRIRGNAVRRVTDVQMANVHTVSAAAAGVKHNWHFEIDYADRVTINGWSALGIDAFETTDLWDAGGAKVTSSKGVKFASGTVHGLSRNPFVIINSDVTIGGAVGVSNWGGAFATGDQRNAVTCNDSASEVVISTGAKFTNERAASTRIGRGSNGAVWSIGQVTYKLAGTSGEDCFAFNSNPAAWSGVQLPFGSGTVGMINVFGRRVTYTGEFDSTGAGTYNIHTLLSSAVDQCYSLSIQQQGNGANATSGMVFANAGNVGVITSGNTNASTPLLNTFNVSGLTVRAVIGSGYGNTTWRYQLTRML